MLTDIEDLEQAKEEAFKFVTPVTGSEYIEIRASANETVTIGYFDGKRFYWMTDKIHIESAKSLAFVTKPPLWRNCSKSE